MSSSVSTLQPPSASRQTTVKLRAACNTCCAAKVKCSGQKSGCDRCRNIGSLCVYLESRVGKVPGVRARRKQSQPSTTINANRSGDQGTYTRHAPRPVTPAPSAHESSFLTSEYDDVLSWSHDTQLAATNHDICHYIDDSTMNTMDFGMNDLLETPPSTINHVEGSDPVPQSQTMPLSLGLRPRNEQDSQCILECCSIIGDLENYIMADLKVFKILLSIVRKALISLTALVSFQQGSRNLRCLFLFDTIMYQVLEMLESSTANYEGDASSLHYSGSISTATSLRMPPLGLGDFGLDPSEQSAWRLQTISKEVHRAMEVLRKMRVLCGVGPNDADAVGNASDKSRERCHADLTLRFQQLRERITQLE